VRRRPGGDVPPAELLTFYGRGYATAQEWERAFDAFHEARAAWLAMHGLTELEVAGFGYTVVGDCPFDPASI
jgi:hypothetical protein